MNSLERGDDDTICVYITTKNRSQLLVRALDSVIQQSRACDEIIVVDDGSVDDTEAVMIPYLNQYPEITYIKNKLSIGACASRNAAINTCNSKFITGLDDDDFFHPERLEHLSKAYRSDLSFVASNFTEIYMGHKSSNSKFQSSRVITTDDLLWDNVIGSQVYTERNKLILSGLFDAELTASQDIDMWIRLTDTYGGGVRINKSLCYTDVGADRERISSNNKRAIPTLRLIYKHRSLMTSSQIFRRLGIACSQAHPEYRYLYKMIFAGLNLKYLLFKFRGSVGLTSNRELH